MSEGRRFVLAGAALALVAVAGVRFVSRGRGPGPVAAAIEASVAPATQREPDLRAPEPVRGAEPVSAAAVAPVPAPVTDPVALDPAATSARAVAPMYIVHGRVVDPAGLRAGSWLPVVSLTDVAGVRRGTKVSSDGHYSLAGLAPGKWTLHWGGVGYRERSEPLELAAPRPIVRRDLTMERAVTREVRVTTRDGEHLYRALRAREGGVRDADSILPVATLDEPGETIEEPGGSRQDSVGVGSFWDHGPLADAAGPDYLGVLVLQEDPPVFVSLVAGSRVVATQRVDAGTEEASFVVDLDALLARQATVRARFLGADRGEALDGGLLIEPLDSFEVVRGGSWSGTLAPGSYTLRFLAQGYVYTTIEITLAPGQELDLGDVVIPLGLTAEGRLLDSEGNPVFGRLVVGRRNARGDLSFDYTIDNRTDASGRFKIHGLEAGRYVVRTVGDDEVTFPGQGEAPTVWVSGNVEVSTLGGSVTGLDLHLVKAGVLRLKGVEGVPGAFRCRLLDEHGDLLRSKQFYPGFVPRLLLPPGAYTLVVFDEERTELSRRALEIGEGTTEVDLTE